MKNLVPTGSNRCFSLVVSGIGGEGAGGRWYVHYGGQNVFGLILKKKLLPLITELVVTLNHLRVKHL